MDGGEVKDASAATEGDRLKPGSLSQAECIRSRTHPHTPTAPYNLIFFTRGYGIGGEVKDVKRRYRAGAG